MARSAEEFRLDEPIDPAPEQAKSSGVDADGDVTVSRPPVQRTRSEPFRREDIQGICVNPLRDEPSTAVITAVRRFGIVGLVTYAIASGLSRWWRSSRH